MPRRPWLRYSAAPRSPCRRASSRSRLRRQPRRPNPPQSAAAARGVVPRPPEFRQKLRNISGLAKQGVQVGLKVPAIDLAEVGAGGGSLIRIDAGGALQIGPQSAGGSPGPVCYDRGGTEPTLTDANVVLGYLNPDHLVGGAVRLDAAKARSVIEERIARSLGMNTEEAAWGAYLIAASNMIRAIKAVSSERGRDPREYALVAFGGNGPLFAVGMARALSIGRVLIPPSAGVFSSYGLLYSEVAYHFTKSRKT